MMTTETKSEALATVQPAALQHELSIEDVLARVLKVKAVMTQVMREDRPDAPGHYGRVPGAAKPTLLKPGAELLLLTFRLDPQYASVETYDGPHLTVKTTCTLWHIPTGMRLGSGEGSCSTKESKYAYRRASRTCPRCGKDESIIKGRAEYGGGWLCYAKKGGCGAKYQDGDAAIEAQIVERVPNPDLADAYNTVLKMANKRSLVAAVLNVTAASEIFTQDMEDARPAEPGPRVTTHAEPEVIEAEGDGRATITREQQRRWHAIASAHGWDETARRELLGAHGYSSTKEIPVEAYDDMIQELKSHRMGWSPGGDVRQPEAQP